mmetsp:Transcript_13159/g.53128  ORF Transcript_13159/g.53128 Transcript_13159/m.53128 type:complete len:300 (+) Transcript_13159:218-1117(+)
MTLKKVPSKIAGLLIFFALSAFAVHSTLRVVPPQPGNDLDAFMTWHSTLEENEFSVFSQNGEDGIIQHIFKYLGETDQFYVEFGTESGIQTNTRFLREQKGWAGLLMDGGHSNPDINLQQERIYPANIRELFDRYGVPKTFDLLSIDIDSFDLWVWRRLLLSDFRARVVVLEFNSNYGLGEYSTFPDPTGTFAHSWEGDTVFGASLDALDLLARQFGYVLTYVDKASVNAFFIREDLLPNKALDALPIHAIHRGIVPLHNNASEVRRNLMVDYLEWSRTYEANSCKQDFPRNAAGRTFV